MRFNHEQLDALLELVQQAKENAAQLVEHDEKLEIADVSNDTMLALENLIEQQAAEMITLQRDRDILVKLSQVFGQATSQLDSDNMRQSHHKRRTEAELRRQRLLMAEQEYNKGLEPNLDDPELQKLYSILQTWRHFNELDSYQEDDIIFMLDRWLRTRDPNSPNCKGYDATFTRGIINANDTGMGKTVETVAFLWVMRQVNPKANIVWFTKTSLTRETAPESTEKWHFDMMPITGTSPDKIAMIGMMKNFPIPMTIAINYEAVNTESVRKELLSIPWDFMVIDEVHKLRGGANYTPTGIWKNTKSFKQETGAWPIMLSGSIINNEEGELWAYLNIMNEERFPSIRQFRDAFQSGLWSRDKLIKILAPSMFRRRKDEVQIKMPERIIQKHLLELDENSTLGKLYIDLSEQMWAELESEGESKTLTLNNMLQRIHYQRAILMAPEKLKVKRQVVDPTTLQSTEVVEYLDIGEPFKLNEIIEFANELIMEGQQVVIATAAFTAPLDYIASKLILDESRVGKIYGTNAKNGGDISAKFRAGEVRVILTNIPSGAEGFNWHKTKDWPGGAEHMILCDDWWNPEKVRQLMDRVWRRGSVEASVNRVIVHLFQVDGTVDLALEQVRLLKEARNMEITESTALRVSDWKQILSDTIRRKTKT